MVVTNLKKTVSSFLRADNALLYRHTTLYRLLAQETLFDAWRALRTGADVAAWREQNVPFSVRADHALV